MNKIKLNKNEKANSYELLAFSSFIT